MVAAYPSLLDEKLLVPQDSQEIARLLHNEFRILSIAKPFAKHVLQHVETFEKLYKSRQLPPHPKASLHLISYYKESKQFDSGIELWNWIIQQDNSYLDLGTYGAAIELLAAYGKNLPYCEEVYQHALRRFPSNFNEYHLSAGAIVSQREEPTTITGTSMTLLQGITQARLVHGDWRHAYLALDTALRLYPTQLPTRFVNLFLEERPFHEAFQVYCMICQSGSPLRAYTLTAVLNILRSAQQTRIEESDSPHHAIAMVTALRAYIASGNKVNTIHMNAFLQGILHMMLISAPSYVMAAAVSDEKVTETISQAMAIFKMLGVSPEESTFNTIITMAAKSRRPKLFAVAIQTLSVSGIMPSDRAWRTYLNAAGEAGSAAQVKSIWNEYVNLKNASGATLSLTDWKLLARVSRKTDVVDFLKDQLELHSIADDRLVQIAKAEQGDEAKVFNRSPNRSPVPIQTHRSNPDWSKGFSQFYNEFSALKSSVDEHIYRNLKEFQPACDGLWAVSTDVDEAWQRKLYDELSLDPSSKSSGSSTTVQGARSSPLSPTGFKLDELRYLSWKVINRLLLQTEVFEFRVEEAVDNAIQQGKPTEWSRSSLKVKTMDKRLELLAANLKVHLQALKDDKIITMTETQWREKVLTLRRTGS